MTARDPDPGADLARLAAEVLAEAVEGARRDAVAELRARIAGWLVQSAEGSLPAARPEAGRDPGPRPDQHAEPADRLPVERPAEERARPEPAAAPGAEPDTGWYVYGLTWEHVAGSLPPMAGVGGNPVEVVPVGRLAMVGSWVERGRGSWGIDDSGEADLDRLAPLVRAHEGVLEALLDRGPVLPLRFGRLYPGREQLRELMDRREGAVADALERLDGRAEWGLTVDWDPEQAGRDRPTAGSDRGGGAGYLAHRRDQMVAAGEAGRVARAEAGRVHDSLAPIADGYVVHGLRRRSGGSRPVVWRASYLVGDHRVEAFRQAAADGLAGAPAELGLGGQLTGPWPPYNFAGIDLDQVPA